MDWINREVERVRNDDAAKQQTQQKQETINAQAWETWDRLRNLMEEAVKRLNASPEMRQRIGEVQFNGNNVQILRLENLVIPSVYITITYGHDGLCVERKRRFEPLGAFDSYTENLDYDLDQNGRVAFRSEQGQLLNAERAVEYILKPLIRKHDDLEFSFPSVQ
ncbi:MAG TPA: hypothetical protein VNG71_12140 [Pyrinomonadaceae bacterium]|nr:hypothetical protein [Pyrinomonadaceae bacterium]